MLRDEILPKTRLDDARKTFGGCGVDACSTDEALGARCWQGRSCGASECVCARAGQTKEGVRHFVGGCCQGRLLSRFRWTGKVAVQLREHAGRELPCHVHLPVIAGRSDLR